MVRKNKPIESKKFKGLDAARSYKFQAPMSTNIARRFLLEAGANNDYMNHLLGIFPEQRGAKPNEEMRLNDDDENEDDPDYTLFLGKLKEDGNAYKFEYEEEDGSKVVVKYEEDSSSDTESDGPSYQMPIAEVERILASHPARIREEIEMLPDDGREDNAPHTPVRRGDSRGKITQQYRRKLRSHAKRIDEGTKEVEKLTRTDPRIEKEENTVEEVELVSRTYSRKPKREYEEDRIRLEPDYDVLIQGLKHVNDHHVYAAGRVEVVYEQKSDRVKEGKEDDDESSDVEIIDSDTFHRVGSLKLSRFVYPTKH